MASTDFCTAQINKLFKIKILGRGYYFLSTDDNIFDDLKIVNQKISNV